MRQIVLDTETTGLEPEQGHRIIEIGCVEVVNRRLTGRHFHCYINPDRDIDDGAVEVHGITSEFLADKPRFADIVEEFLAFVEDAELVIHNAPFDVGFLDHELARLDLNPIGGRCGVLDTLVLARAKHPGQRNSLDALCKRYGIDNSQRALHGALLDAEILADVYLVMTGGQTALVLDNEERDEEREEAGVNESTTGPERLERVALTVIRAADDELRLHEEKLDRLDKVSGQSLWRSLSADL